MMAISRTTAGRIPGRLWRKCNSCDGERGSPVRQPAFLAAEDEGATFCPKRQVMVDANGCLRLHRALRACIDCVERRRATDVEPVALLAAEAEVGDRLRNVDLAEQLASGRVTAHAVLVRIAPADRAPDISLAVGAHAIG